MVDFAKMLRLSKCPKCGERVDKMVLTDSDDRILQRFRRCPKCQWDERTDGGA